MSTFDFSAVPNVATIVTSESSQMATSWQYVRLAIQADNSVWIDMFDATYTKSWSVGGPVQQNSYQTQHDSR